MSIIYLSEELQTLIAEVRREKDARCGCCQDWTTGPESQVTLVIEPHATIGRFSILCKKCKIALEKICDQVANGEKPTVEATEFGQPYLNARRH